MGMDNPFKKEEESAVFNMALATLKRVDELLSYYSQISIDVQDNFSRVVLKIKQAKQIYLASVPLIRSANAKKILKESVNNLEILYVVKYNPVSRKNESSYKEDAEERIDHIVACIQETLQKDKYFMPTKTGGSWKES